MTGLNRPEVLQMNATEDRAKSIFLSAVEIAAPDERRAFIKIQCGGDESLRGEVEELLRHQQSLGSFLNTPPAGLDVTVERTVSERPGTVIGPYKLLQQIGEGGMGIVFMAEQSLPIQRTVALKIIKPGMDTRQVIARFEAERQAVAMMDHPNIAKVLDAGTTDSGRPYFVMELVKGVPITKYCDEKQLALRARLELFVQVCQAVQHAHQKGIIHRDIKPNNVLVAEYDNEPIPKVIDFGVAKATAQKLTERTMFTEFGQVLGTVEYMSPEQAKLNQLDIDTRSDIYSLGVLLYELLAGSTPIEGKRLREAAFDEMLRLIREEEPPKPSTRISSIDTLPSIAVNRHTEPARLSKDVRGELDWIVMKALEKDRNRRYETAGGFAADIDRHLKDEPVEAGPPSATYRFRKFARRNKAALITAVLFAVVLVLGSVISTWQAVRATRAEALSQQRLQAEKQARANAVTQAAKATAISDLLQDALQSANPDNVKGVDYTVRQLLDDLSDGLTDQLKDQPQAEAAIHATVGNAYRRLGLPHDAEPHLKKAIELRRVLGHDHLDVAQSLLDHSYNAFEHGNWAAAEAESREALAIFKKGNDDEQTLNAFSLLHLFVRQQDKVAEAQAIADEAFAFAKSAGFKEHPALAKILHNLVHVRIAAGKGAEAEQLAAKAVAMHRRLNGNVHPETGWALFSLGLAFKAQEKHLEAETALREALAIFRKQYDESHKSIVSASQELQTVLTSQGDEAGLAALRADKAARLSKALELQGGNLNLRLQLGNFLRDAGDVNGAISQFSEVIARDPKLTDAWAARGKGYLNEGEFEKAADDIAKLRELRPTTDLEISFYYNDAGYVLHGKRRLKEAEHAYRQALLLKQKAAAAFPDDPTYRFHLTFTYAGLVSVLRDTNQLQEAAKLRDEAAPIFEKVAADNPKSVEQQLALPHFLRDAGDVDAALAQCSKILARNPELVEVWSLRGNLYLAKDEFAKAAEEFSQAIKLQADHGDAWTGRAYAYFHLQQWEKAASDFSKAIALDPQVHGNWLHRGHAHLQLAEWHNAAADFTKVIDGWPDDPSGGYWRALAYAQLNQPDKAVADLRRAIAKGYDNVEQLETDPLLDPLRSNEDFVNVITTLEKEKAGGSDIDSK
jgi:serine/threonine protein kinase/tetratricopeptide (TPR) repeat protein